jgi:hypothetical protein
MRSHAKASFAGSTKRRAKGLGCLLLAALFALLVLAIPASAVETHVKSIAFGAAGSGDGQFELAEHSGVAVNEATHDVYVADAGNRRVDQFDSAGNFIRAFGADVGGAGVNVCTTGCVAGTSASAPGAFESPTFIAIDNSSGASSGDVYVGDANNIVSKFHANGTLVSGWGAGGQISGDGTEAFGELAGIAVDSTGNLLVYQTASAGFIYKFDQSGAFTNKSSTARGTEPKGIAVDPDGNFYKANGDLSVEKFKASGADVGQLTSSLSTTGLAADPANGKLYVDNGGSIDSYAFNSSGEVVESGGTVCPVEPSGGEDGVACAPSDSFGSGDLTFGAGLAVDGTSHDVYAADPGAARIVLFEAVITATATTEAATTIHHTDAILNGSLDPGAGEVTACEFEWGTTTSYGGGTVPCNEGNSFSAPADVSANLGFLTPGTTIHYRLHIATTANGEVDGEDESFTPTPFPIDFAELASFGPDGTAASSFSSSISSPGALAFASASERLYANDSGVPGIYGFDASAPPAFAPLSAFDPLTVGGPTGFPELAVDNTGLSSAGNVYYSDFGGTNRIYGFDSSGAPLGGNFPIDTETNPPGGAGTPSFTGGLAVDSSGGLWVSDVSTQHVLHYNSAGVFQDSIDISSLAGNPFAIAFDSNDDLYVDIGIEALWKLTAASGYSPASATKLVSPSGFFFYFALDRASGNIYIPQSGPARISAYNSSGSHLSDFAEGIAGAGFEGLTVNPTTHDVYAADAGNHKVRVFRPSPPQREPTLTPGDPTAITGSSTTLNAKVDPETIEVTDCHFEYGTTASYGNSAPCAPDPGSGSGDVAVHGDISGLNGGTTYHFRIVAENSEGFSAAGPDQTLITKGPRISAQTVEAVGNSDVTLSAKINPAGEASTYHVEYGTTTSYGQSTPESNPIGFAGDESLHTVSVHIAGLNPGTTYHFRFVATSAGGTNLGADATFATYGSSPSMAPCPNDRFRTGFGTQLPDCRAYEQVTPTDKHGANIQGRVGASIEAASDGSRITFNLNGGLPTPGGSSNLVPYLASRSPSGWSFDGLIPLTDPSFSADVLGWSEDLSTTLSTAPGPGNVGRAIYLHNSDTTGFQFGATGNARAVADFAADGSHFLFESNEALAPGAVAEKQNLYDFDHGDLTLAGRIPTGSATSCDDESGPACVPAPEGSFAGPYGWFDHSCPGAGATCRYFTQNTISRDGSKAIFTAAGSRQLYVREDGTKTTRISASQRTVPDPNGERPAAFMAATPDGSKVFFASCEKLTDDSTAVSNGENSCVPGGFGQPVQQGMDLYSYDTGTGELTDLSVDPNASDPLGAGVVGVFGASDDGSYVYFAANGVLAEGAAPGKCSPDGGPSSARCNLYLTHNGNVTFVGSLGEADSGTWQPTPGVNNSKLSRVSTDGRTLLFSSILSLTGYDNTLSAAGLCGNGNAGEPCAELFRYSALDEALACVSCNPTGTPPRAGAGLGSNAGFGIIGAPAQTFLTRNLSSDGEQVFFESEDALLPRDTNGIRDVYEWEAKGSGSCETESQNGGCLYLLSSGTSPAPSHFADASVNGDHAFIFTSQQMVPGDHDQLMDIYDASTGGGLASQHALTPPTCSSTACQANPAPPPDQPAASAVFSGQGNVKPKPSARKCGKGRRKVRRAGKVRCQKAHKQHKRHDNRGGSK